MMALRIMVFERGVCGFWMQVLKCAGYAGVVTGSILVYAYTLMYYTKNRGFENHGFLAGDLGEVVI